MLLIDDAQGRIVACTHVIEASKTDEERADAYERRAAGYNKAKDLPKAIADITRAIELAPKTSRIRSRAMYLDDTGDYKQSLADMDKVVAADPKDLFIRWLRAGTLVKVGDTASALAAYGEWIAVAPEDSSPYFLRADLFNKKKDWAAALKDLDRSISLKPDFVPAYLSRAKAHFELGNKDKALADVSRVIASKPDEYVGHVNRALMYENYADGPAALADYDVLVQLQPNNNFVRERRAQLVAKYHLPDNPPAPIPGAAPATAPSPGADAPIDCRTYVPAVDILIPVPCPE
jgi:tetratricopeptide (TPR) repeat protein